MDLGRATFIEPAALVTFAVLLDMATANDWPVVFIPPTVVEAQRYRSRMGLQDLLDATDCGVQLPAVRQHPPDHRFVELQRFDGDHPADDVADLLINRLQDWNDGH